VRDCALVRNEACCGYWEGPYDWGILTCNDGNPVNCPVSQCGSVQTYYEIPHAVLILVDPNVRPQVWRVLLWNTGKPVTSTTTTAWWVWDAATPGAATRGIPDVPHNIFCSGYTILSNRKVLVGGGVDWSYLVATPPSCTYGGAWAYIYDPNGAPPAGGGPGKWSLIPPAPGVTTSMVKPRYYPGAFLLPPDQLTPLFDKVAVMTGDTAGTTVTVEVYDGVTGVFTGTTEPYSTTPQCAMAYPRLHVLPSPNPAQYRGTLFTSSPYVYSGVLCGAPPGIPVKTQRLDLPMNGIGSPPAWMDGPTPATQADRTDNGSVLLIDAAGHATVIMGAGKNPAPPNDVYATIETVTDPQLGGTWSTLPNLNHARFDQAFVVLPGK